MLLLIRVDIVLHFKMHLLAGCTLFSFLVLKMGMACFKKKYFVIGIIIVVYHFRL